MNLGQFTLPQLLAQRAALQTQLDALPDSWSFAMQRAQLKAQIHALDVQIAQLAPPPTTEPSPGPGPDLTPWLIGGGGLLLLLFLAAGRQSSSRARSRS